MVCIVQRSIYFITVRALIVHLSYFSVFRFCGFIHYYCTESKISEGREFLIWHADINNAIKKSPSYQEQYSIFLIWIGNLAISTEHEMVGCRPGYTTKDFLFSKKTVSCPSQGRFPLAAFKVHHVVDSGKAERMERLKFGVVEAEVRLRYWKQRTSIRPDVRSGP